MSEYYDLPNIEPNPPAQQNQPDQQRQNNLEIEIQKPEDKKPDPRLNQKILVGIIIIMVVLAIIFGLRDSKNIDQVNEADEIMETDEQTFDENAHITSDGVFNYQLASEWEDTEIATINIGLLGQGQVISGGIVSDPNDNDVVYFASLIYTADPESSQVGIYKYYLSNNNFERIFRAEYAVDEFSYLVGGVPGLNTYGYDNGKLILLAHVIGASPGSCTQPVLLGSGDRQSFNLLSMDLEDPYAGFEEYTASEATITQAEAVMAECQGEVTE
ncbi:MAG: hypothetical protein ABIH67_04660 [Candidatus Uhrbacteria bacterium]